MCDFKPGDEVVARHGWCSRALCEGLEEGRAYVIESMGPSASGHTIMLDFDEFPTARFDWRGFRKVQRKSTETGMAMLRDILDGKDVTAPVVEIA